MKYALVILLALSFGACTTAQDERTREQAHETADKAKHDAQVALEKAKVETQKASRELDQDLHKVREKAREALNQPEDGKR